MNDPKHGMLSQYYESFHEERGKKGTVADPARLSFLETEVGTGKDVVELGCRYGDILELVGKGNRLTGLDIDRKALEICAKRTGAVTQIADLNAKLPLEDSSFDIVIITEVLEHLPYPEITLAEAARVLRPGGKIVGSVPNAVRLRNRLMFLLSGVVEIDRTHLQHFGEASLAKRLSLNFKSIVVREVSGRFVRLWPSLFANLLLFSGVKR